MAVNRNKNQKILVNGEPFMWKVKSHWDYTSVVIQHEIKRHQYIISSIESGLTLNGKILPITPCMIKDVILRALEKGWDPCQKSNDYMFIELKRPLNLNLKQYWDIQSN